MAHEFRDLGSNTTFVSKREIPWHRLGKVVDSMTSEEAIKLAGMDFTVGIAPIYANIGVVNKEAVKTTPRVVRETYKVDGVLTHEFHKVRKVTDKFCTYREDTGDVFGIVGSKYEVIQNTEAFDFFDSITGDKLAIYETAGALGNGERVFISAKLPSYLEIHKDCIEQYLLLSTTHDGSGSINVLFTPIRVVCNNTLSAAIRGATNMVRVKHTKNAKQRLEYSKQVLGIVDKNGRALNETFKHLHKQVIHDDAFDKFVMDSLGYSPDNRGIFSDMAMKKLDAITEYYHTGFGQAEIIGTKYGAFNAITGYFQNVEPIKDDDKFFTSNFYGKGATIRQKSLDLLLQD